MFYVVDLADIVIPNGGTESNALDVGSVNSLAIFAPAALTGTVTLQISPDGENWYNAKSGGDNIAVAVDAGVVITNGGYKYLRLISGSTEAAARTFKVSMQEEA